MAEQHQARNILFRELTNVPHRVYGPAVARFRQALASDPDFTARTCVHLAMGGSEIRDLQDVSIITLLTAPNSFPEYREAGRCLMLGRDVYEIEPQNVRGLPPFRILRIEAWLRSPWVVSRRGEEVERSFTRQHALQRVQANAAALAYRDSKVSMEDFAKQFTVRKDPDHFRPSRLMRGLVVDYVRMLEDDAQRFDGVVLRNRRELKSAYKFYHIKPSDRARAILFEDNPPADSRLAVLKQIANCADAHERARLIIEHKIPYVVAASVLPKMGAIEAVALIDVMSPQEALNSRHWVEESGILNIAEVKDAFTTKVSKATASIATAEHRASAQGKDEDVQAAVNAAKEKATEKNRIEGEVLICADISWSMDAVIKAVPQFISRIIPQCDDRVFLSWFNDAARTVEVTGMNYQGCQDAVKGVRAGGGTRPQAALESALKVGCMPNKLVMVTDGGERSGSFTRTLRRSGLEPQLAMIRLPGDPNWLAPRLREDGFVVDVFETDGTDYYVFDQVITLLSGEPVLSIIESIMQTELPRRV